MGEIIFSVIVITVFTMFFIIMFLDNRLEVETKIWMGISIFFTTIIISLLNFLINILS